LKWKKIKHLEPRIISMTVLEDFQNFLNKFKSSNIAKGVLFCSFPRKPAKLGGYVQICLVFFVEARGAPACPAPGRCQRHLLLAAQATEEFAGEAQRRHETSSPFSLSPWPTSFFPH
jgi:hypothetical protein